MIKNIKTEENGKKLIWEVNGQTYQLSYPYPIYYVLTPEKNKIVIVEPDNEYSPNNAVITNELGNELIRINNPLAKSGAICFGDIYYSKDKINLISICPQTHYRCVIDTDGKTLEIHETR